MSQGIMHGDLVCKLNEELLMVKGELDRLRAENTRLESDHKSVCRQLHYIQTEHARLVAELAEEKGKLDQRHKAALEKAKVALTNLTRHYEGLLPGVPMWIEATRALAAIDEVLK